MQLNLLQLYDGIDVRAEKLAGGGGVEYCPMSFGNCPMNEINLYRFVMWTSKMFPRILCVGITATLLVYFGEEEGKIVRFQLAWRNIRMQ